MSRPPTRLIVAAVGVVLVAIGAVVLLTRSGNTTSQPTASSTHAGTGDAPATAPSAESGGSAGLVARHYPVAAAAQQTSPSVSPRSGTTTTSFTLKLTPKQTLGAHGHVQLAYRVVLNGPRPRCAVFTQLATATRGAVAHVKLNPPIELGWCRGTIHGVVLLETNPYCPPPPADSKRARCHVFATRLSDVGRFEFVTQ